MRITHYNILKLILTIFVPIFIACTSNGTNTTNDSHTIEADSVVMAVDTATIITELNKNEDNEKTQEPEEPLLDSLASAETAVEFMQNSGHWDKYQQGIIPSILEQNLDYGRRLIRNRHNYFIIVDKESMQVILFDKYGCEVKSYLMACSRYYGTKHKRRDNRTPEGFFSASGVYNSTDWLYTDDDGRTSQKKGQFGPRFIRLKTPVTSQVGIHGTSSPNSPGKRVSHGCIRVRNENILELVEYVSIGMPIIVNPSERDQKVNIEEGYDNIVKLDIGKESYSKQKKQTESEKAKGTTSESKSKTDSTKTKAEKNDSIPSSAKPIEYNDSISVTPDTLSTDSI